MKSDIHPDHRRKYKIRGSRLGRLWRYVQEAKMEMQERNYGNVEEKVNSAMGELKIVARKNKLEIERE